MVWEFVGLTMNTKKKIIKTLLCIEGITDDSLMLDVDCKLNMYGDRYKNTFTQEEAQEMGEKLLKIYQLSHNILSSCYFSRHDTLLEKVYKGLIKADYIDKDTLKETIESVKF
jgi:predicted acetyltransferase